uniref:Uncharacterized protein n=1 Tax=Anguilla anguilla TaxID=7936 RepID=A0A0E9WA63_ANGAN
MTFAPATHTSLVCTQLALFFLFSTIFKICFGLFWITQPSSNLQRGSRQ